MTQSYVEASPVRMVGIQEAALKISNDCGPCCECQDFINVYEAIRNLSKKYSELGRRMEAVRDQYRLNIERWEAQRECRAAHLIQVALLPIPPCRLAVAASLCNGTRDPLHDVALTLDFSASTAAGCVVCNTTYRRGNADPYRAVSIYQLMPYRLSGNWPIFYANFDCINPGDNGYVTFMLQFPYCTQGDTVTLTVSATAAGESNPGGAAPVTASSGLLAYFDTGNCCEWNDEE